MGFICTRLVRVTAMPFFVLIAPIFLFRLKYDERILFVLTLGPPHAAVGRIGNFMNDPPEHLLALPCPRRGDLFEPKWKPVLFGFGAECPCPIEVHRAPSGKILWRPLRVWCPKVFLAVAGFAAADCHCEL